PDDGRRDAHEDAVRGDRELHPDGELRCVREGVQGGREGVQGMSPLFRSKAREEAEGALVSADDTLAILESGRADLGPARRMRERAASLLARLHTAAWQGIVRLRAERGGMAKLGMSVEDVDALVTSAEAWMSKTVERDGDPAFPAYAKSAELALRGLKLASGRIPRYKEA